MICKIADQLTYDIYHSYVARFSVSYSSGWVGRRAALSKTVHDQKTLRSWRGSGCEVQHILLETDNGGLGYQQVDQEEVWHVDLVSGTEWSECSVAKVWEYQFPQYQVQKRIPLSPDHLAQCHTSLPYSCRQSCAQPLVCCYVVAKNTQFILVKNTAQNYYTLIRYTVSL